VRRVSAVAGVWALREHTLCFTVYPPYLILTSYVGVTGFESRPGYWTLYYYYYYYYLLTYLLRLSFHSVAVVLTQVQTKQIRIDIHKRSNTKTLYRQYKTQYMQVYILPTHPHNCQNTPTYTHPHITRQVQTTTIHDTHQMK